MIIICNNNHYSKKASPKRLYHLLPTAFAQTVALFHYLSALTNASIAGSSHSLLPTA